MGKKTRLQRVFVLGLDGATFEIICPLIREGKLPNLERVLSEGTSGSLESTVPPLTAPAWISFVTGKNAGKHGIFSFRNFDAASYECFRPGVVNSNSFRDATLFDILSRNGLRVAAICVPMTYPAWPINGVMVSGYPVGNIARAFYPADLAQRVERNLFWPANTHKKPIEELLEEVNDLLRSQMEFVLELIEDGSFKFIMVNIDNLDNAVHHFWHLHDIESPVYSKTAAERYGNLVEQQYEKVDRYVGELLEALPDETNLIVMSDHGGGRAPDKYFHTNAWLKSQGLLFTRSEVVSWRSKLSQLLPIIKENLPIKDQLRRFLPESIKSRLSKNILNISSIDWNQTLAYRIPFKPRFEGIEINLYGRQPQGVVKPGAECDRLVSSLLASLQSLKDYSSGEPVVEKVCRKEELFSGSFLERIPDLIVQFHDRFDGGTNTEGDLVTDVPLSLLRAWPGNHKSNGIFIARGKPFQSGFEVHGVKLIDLLPTFLHLFDIPIPEDLDGRVVHEIFAGEFQGEVVKREALAFERETEADHLSQAEEEEIINRLKGLGYM